jgi:hypothetical protein
MSLRQSRAVAVAFVTFATFTDLMAHDRGAGPPDLARRLGASPTMIAAVCRSA